MENICILFINCHLLLIGTQAFAVKDSDVKEFYGDNPVNSLREQVGETEIREAIRKPSSEWMYTSTDSYILSQQGINSATLETRVKWQGDDKGNILSYTYDIFKFPNVKKGVNTIKSYKHYELLQGVARLTLAGEAAAAGVELLGVRDAVEHVYHVYANGKYALVFFLLMNTTLSSRH